MSMDFEIYSGKSFQDLCRDIVSNQEHRKEQVESMMGDLRPLIKTVEDAMRVVPLIRLYMDVGVHNDEHLVRLASIVQKIISSKVESGDNSGSLTADEREQLLKQVEDEVKQIEKEQAIMVRSVKKDQ